MKCEKCGFEFEKAKFCPECGAQCLSEITLEAPDETVKEQVEDTTTSYTEDNTVEKEITEEETTSKNSDQEIFSTENNKANSQESKKNESKGKKSVLGGILLVFSIISLLVGCLGFGHFIAIPVLLIAILLLILKKKNKTVVVSIVLAVIALILSLITHSLLWGSSKSDKSEETNNEELSETLNQNENIADNSVEEQPISQVDTSNTEDIDWEEVWSDITGTTLPENEYVSFVKNGYKNLDPNIKIGDVFDEFLSDTEWNYFRGEMPGPDEDGDGTADYMVEVDVVEVTGGCLYQGVEVEALIQFQVDMDDGTFKETYLSFNEVPQYMYMLSILEQRMYENYYENHPQQTPYVEVETNENVYVSEYNEDFVGLFEGEWTDQSFPMDIYISYNGKTYDIDMYNDTGFNQIQHYSLVGNANQYGEISYTGNAMLESYDSNGQLKSSYVLNEKEEGTFYFSDGLLRWYDEFMPNFREYSFDKIGGIPEEYHDVIYFVAPAAGGDEGSDPT